MAMITFTYPGEQSENRYECKVSIEQVLEETLVSDNLTQHEDTDRTTDKIPYCEHCKKRCPESCLKEHIQTHTKVKPYQCEQCEKSYAWAHTLETRMRTHTKRKRRYHCEHCRKKFFDSESYEQHIKATHEESNQCQQCRKSFATQRGFKRHMLKHTTETLYHCEQCEMSFIRYCNLKQHMVTHTIRKPYQCEQFAVNSKERVGKIHVSELYSIR
uniref:Zinc finger protein 77-like n=1 Tax=Saccoglossus kowalevskii TaxID=10224 RepID=A0ABM0LU92_SACKO|nr:PREDICTED: zinc finger protein 77-like [Saccoglossus kowalevskii]